MEKTIGGLFQTEEQAGQAYQALQRAGFDGEAIKVLLRKQAGVLPPRESVSIKSVAVWALIGGLIGGAVAALLGFLIGQGVINIPAFVPLSGPFFTLNAFGLFLLEGVVTGAILGTILRLATAREKPAFVSSGVTHGGVVVAVDAKESRDERARNVMEQAGALDVTNLSETWDEGVWTEFRELQRS